jgi:hypothetical protein
MHGQNFESIFENRTRQMWAVTIEGNDASLVVSREVRKYGREACGKAFTSLGNHVHFTACQLRQLASV